MTKLFFATCLLALIATPAVAHKVEVVGDVAGTWHIEPNHNPRVGVPARTWVALTRRGGALVPLSQANCQMAVYSKPRRNGDKPMMRPTLRAIAAERYQGIPGTDITFPRVGLYQLQLSCSPKTKGSFQPFQMQYDVTVAQ